MKYQLWAIMILWMGLCGAEPKYWELQQGELEKLVRDSDLVIQGKFTKNTTVQVEIEEVLQGPQKVRIVTLKPSPSLEEHTADMDPTRSYLCFLKKEDPGWVQCSTFSPQSILKSDLFLLSRVKKEIMNWRVERAHFVTLALVKSTQEVKDEKGDFQGTAECETVKNFKGEIPKIFSIKYLRLAKSSPPMVYLFDNMTYFFFLTKEEKGSSYSLMNPYEGAYSQRLSFLKDLKLVTGEENRFDEIAGQSVQGIRLFARLEKESVEGEEKAPIHVLLQNEGEKEIEIYHNQFSYFLLLHVIDEDGKLVTTHYPKKNSVPTVHNRYFMKLAPKAYLLLPPLDIQQYCALKPGKYSIYVEYELPWEYAGKTIGKSAWSGKIMSNKIEITVSLAEK